MQVNKSENISFKNNYAQPAPKKREFIDILTDSVTNPRDINDCVAVPRGLFKAYMLIIQPIPYQAPRPSLHIF